MELGSIFMLLAVVLLVGIYVSSPLFTRSSDRDKSKDAPPKPDENTFLPVQVDHQDHSRSSLLADYERLLNSLQELEFDHALGKIPAEDYPKQRALLMQSGAEVLQKLDSIQAAVDAAENAQVADPAGSISASERFGAAVQAKLAADSGTAPLVTAAPLQVAKAEGPIAASQLVPNGVQSAPSAQLSDKAKAPNGAAAVKQAVQPELAGLAVGGHDEPVVMSDADLESIISARRQARQEKASGFCPKCGKPVQKSDRFCPKCGKALQ